MQQLGLTYDLFTSTHTENHFKVSQDIFLKLQRKRHTSITQTEQQWYCAGREALFARPLRGRRVLYLCHFPNARGDQCDNCGNLLDATLLINPRASTSGLALELRDNRALLPGPGQAGAAR